MNKKILIVFLSVVSVFMGYMTYTSIHDEILYKEKVKEIDNMVIGRLDTLRRMQLAYRDMKGSFAKNFDQLFDFMENGKYVKLKQIGENDGEVNNAQIDSLFLNPKAEILGNADIDLKRFKMVPPQDTAMFKMDAGTILQNNVMVPVFEIEDPHPFNKEIKPLKVGDMNNAITNGNWK